MKDDVSCLKNMTNYVEMVTSTIFTGSYRKYLPTNMNNIKTRIKVQETIVYVEWCCRTTNASHKREKQNKEIKYSLPIQTSMK